MEHSGGMVQLGGTSTKLILACDQEPGVQGRRSDVHPRNIHGIIHSLTAAGQQQSSEEEW